MKKRVIVFFFTLMLLCACDNVMPNAQWQNVSTGLEYKESRVNNFSLIMARINPSLFRFKIIENAAPPKSLSMREIHEQYASPLSFNGAFYTPEFTATGLLMSESKTLSKANNATLTNGIFLIENNNNPRLITTDEYLAAPDQIKINSYFAIQNGPILLDAKGNIAIKNDDERKASRTIMAIDKEQNIIVIIIRQTLLKSENALSLYEMAKLMHDNEDFKNMDLHSALNLDGGNSSGIAIADNYYPEMEKVQNIIITEAIK